MTRVLVTGTRGYLGSAISQQVFLRGCELIPLKGRLEDIAPGSLEVDVVIHCAAALLNRPGQWDTSNRLGTQTLLEGLRKPTPIIFVSSRSVYAPETGDFLDESTPLGPINEYGWSKLQSENLIRESHHPWVFFRPTAIFGFGVKDCGTSFTATALKRFLLGQPVTLHAPDRQVDYVYVHFLAELLVEAIGQSTLLGQAFNVSGPPRSLHGLIQRLAEHAAPSLPAPPQIEICPGPPPRTVIMRAEKFKTFYDRPQPGDDRILREMVIQSFQLPPD